MSQDEAIYNIGVVVRMTGIPAATLRIWERRYDFPVCVRTEGGHRLYTRSEIDRLRWVKAKTDPGMQIRQAVRALETLGSKPEQGMTAANALNAMRESTLGQSPAVESYLHILQHRLHETLLRHNIEEADAVFDEALVLYAPEDIILNLIGPTLSDIGMGWEKGEVMVATEHLASHYLRRRLITWMNLGPPVFDVPPAALACAPGEYHEGGLLMFGVLLRRRRWPVTYLGQSTPLTELASFVKQTAPSAIVVVAMTEEPAAALAEWPMALPKVAEAQRPVFGYAGRIFNQQPEWRSRVPGVFLGATLGEGVQTLERILQSHYVPMG